MVTSREKLKKLNLHPDDYRTMVEWQENRCLICGTEAIGRALAIDHDHRTGVVRGLLCTRCNMGLGYFLDRVDILERAVEYMHAARERYGDCCQKCRREHRDFDARRPHHIDPDGPGRIRADYRCERCGSTWPCWWTTTPLHLFI